jgi:multiple sugar transport system permease protein
MPTRVLGLSLRMAILVLFAIFFVAPILWLFLAPTKSDHALILDSPFTFGSFHQVALAWKHLDHFSNHVYRQWIINSLVFSATATAITLVVGIPAGYGLALV